MTELDPTYLWSQVSIPQLCVWTILTCLPWAALLVINKTKNTAIDTHRINELPGQPIRKHALNVTLFICNQYLCGAFITGNHVKTNLTRHKNWIFYERKPFLTPLVTGPKHFYCQISNNSSYNFLHLYYLLIIRANRRVQRGQLYSDINEVSCIMTPLHLRASPITSLHLAVISPEVVQVSHLC